MTSQYPAAVDFGKVGTYPAFVRSGGGFFYDEVLEYRVWVHPAGKDVFYEAFATYEEAKEFSQSTPDAEIPLVLVYQEEYIDEPDEGHYVHLKEPRLTEWKPEWLEGTKGTKKNIAAFLKDKANY